MIIISLLKIIILKRHSFFDCSFPAISAFLSCTLSGESNIDWKFLSASTRAKNVFNERQSGESEKVPETASSPDRKTRSAPDGGRVIDYRRKVRQHFLKWFARRKWNEAVFHGDRNGAAIRQALAGRPLGTRAIRDDCSAAFREQDYIPQRGVQWHELHSHVQGEAILEQTKACTHHDHI